MEEKERQIPLAPLGRYPHFLFPLKKTGFFFSFCLGSVIEQNKQVVAPSPPLDCSYFRLGIRWATFCGEYYQAGVSPDSHRVHQWHHGGCPTPPGGNPATSPCLTVAEWAGDAIFDRTQSRLSRWCQSRTLRTKCVANLVNSQHKSLQVLCMYRRPTVQIQASRICNFIF